MMTKITRIYKKILRKLYQNAIYHTLRTVLITDCLLMAKFYMKILFDLRLQPFFTPSRAISSFIYCFDTLIDTGLDSPMPLQFCLSINSYPTGREGNMKRKLIIFFAIKHTYICSDLITITQLCGKEKIMRDLLSLGCGWRSQYKILVTLAYPNTKEI